MHALHNTSLIILSYKNCYTSMLHCVGLHEQNENKRKFNCKVALLYSEIQHKRFSFTLRTVKWKHKNWMHALFESLETLFIFRMNFMNFIIMEPLIEVWLEQYTDSQCCVDSSLDIPDWSASHRTTCCCNLSRYLPTGYLSSPCPSAMDLLNDKTQVWLYASI